MEWNLCFNYVFLCLGIPNSTSLINSTFTHSIFVHLLLYFSKKIQKYKQKKKVCLFKKKFTFFKQAKTFDLVIYINYSKSNFTKENRNGHTSWRRQCPALIL